jgi:transcription elongation factor Elf1
MLSEQEKFFKCPFCLEKISMILDLSENGQQSYTEDCEVCCNPILITYEASNLKLISFRMEKAYE